MAVREQVQLWFAQPDEIRDEDLLAAYRDLLPDEERQTLEERSAPSARREFLIGRALLRTALSRNRPEISPGAWRFRKNRWGRPETSVPATAASLRFNLSHTPGLMVCAIAEGREVGVDVERVRSRPFSEIAEDFFAPAEVRALRELPESEREARFFQIWTLKESYIKARGMGLAIDLGLFHFELKEGEPPSITVDASLGDRADRWRFASERPSPTHWLALATRTAGPVEIERWRSVPLQVAESLD